MGGGPYFTSKSLYDVKAYSLSYILVEPVGSLPKLVLVFFSPILISPYSGRVSSCCIDPTSFILRNLHLCYYL